MLVKYSNKKVWHMQQNICVFPDLFNLVGSRRINAHGAGIKYKLKDLLSCQFYFHDASTPMDLQKFCFISLISPENVKCIFPFLIIWRSVVKSFFLLRIILMPFLNRTLGLDLMSNCNLKLHKWLKLTCSFNFSSLRFIYLI